MVWRPDYHRPRTDRDLQILELEDHGPARCRATLRTQPADAHLTYAG